MNKPLNILFVEDNPADTKMMLAQLRTDGFDPTWKRIETEADFLAEIRNSPDIILSDYSMPQFSGLRAAELLRESGLEIPFILISGTVGEDVAVDAMKHGATDYLLKDRIVRLGSAVERALRETRAHSERKQAGTELRWKTALLQAQLHSSLDGILVVDSQGKKILQNQRMNDLWKIPPEIAVDSNDAVQIEFVTQRTKDPRQFVDKIAHLYSHPDEISRDEIELIDGTVLDRYSAPVLDQAGINYGRIWSFRDITERRKMQESHARLAMSVEQATECVIITDTSGAILYVNPAFEKSSGYTVAEALGKNPSILKSDKHDAEFYRQMWSTIERGEVWRGHMVNRRKDGTLYEEEATISALRDAAGEVINYVAVKQDVTRERQLEAQFRQSQKMEGIGQLAGGVAHDFNNILAAIMMQAELTGMDENISQEVREGLLEIKGAADRAANLTRQLLLFSRKEVMQSRQLDLNDLVTSLAKMLQRIIREDVQLRLHLHSAPLLTVADAGMLDQLLMNLAVNARDAMPRGGELIIETAEKAIIAGHADLDMDALPGRYVWLSVSDTGGGIPPEIQSRMFEPFFTTKEVGKGTGLGLATVFGIVKQHKGWIKVDSEVGVGTTFQVFLPASAEPADAVLEDEKPLTKALRGSETILVAEDDEPVRMLTRVVLERHGYHVLEAADGVEAQQVWNEHRGQIALLLTDLIMPGGVDGRELALRLQTENPNLRVIFTSGYSAEIAGRELKMKAGQNFVQKPCPPGQLLEAVRHCLDRRTAV
ncbi:MAG: response regulator [Verrucomicrobiae bacterium]|nr:response regulator [Verrucomicrobiae bacterium]